jgi:hypothetical protein
VRMHGVVVIEPFHQLLSERRDELRSELAEGVDLETAPLFGNGMREYSSWPGRNNVSPTGGRIH